MDKQMMIEKALRDRILNSSASREGLSNSQCQVPAANPYYHQINRPSQQDRKAFTSEGGKRNERSNNIFRLRHALESQYSINNDK